MDFTVVTKKARGLAVWPTKVGSSLQYLDHALLTLFVSVYLELDVWLLFKELIPHLPAANLARFLRDHGFLDIVLKTMRSIQESMNERNSRIQQDAAFSTSNKTSESPCAANSSSATVGASVKPTHLEVKKSQPVDAQDENNHSSPKQETRLGRLYRTLCATVWRLQRLAKDDSHGYAVEHLKMVLRASSEQASEMLGISLSMTDYMFQATEGSGVHYNSFDLTVNQWVTIWNCRSRKTPQENVDVCCYTHGNLWYCSLTIISSRLQPTASFLRSDF